MSLPRKRKPSKSSAESRMDDGLDDLILDDWDTPRPKRKPRRPATKTRRRKPESKESSTRKSAARTRSSRRRKHDSNLPPIDEPFTYHGYDGEGYPKGLGDGEEPEGPLVARYDSVNKKYVAVRGIPYEELPESYQMNLDKRPYDEAGQLRIYVDRAKDNKGHYKIEGGYYVEYGSHEEAKLFFKNLERMGKTMNNGENIGYSARPADDDYHVFTRENSKVSGFQDPDKNKKTEQPKQTNRNRGRSSRRWPLSRRRH